MKFEQRQMDGGFTLIELIIVIVIIGVLSAVAIPRFINQTGNARKAALNGLAGAINTAASLAQAQYRSEGNSSSSTVATTTMDGQSVTVVPGSGFPDTATTGTGIGTALRSSSGFTPTYTSTTATYDFSNPLNLSTCNVVYTATTGIAVANTSGC